MTQRRLGDLYSHGKIVPQDYKKAAKWYHLSAEQGNFSICALLEVLYYQGKGVKQDYKKAAHYFRHAAKRHNILA